MKKLTILLIISMLISWNAVAEEKVWYCAPEAHIGLHYEKGSGYSESTFSNVKRVIVKQNGSHLSMPNTFGTRLYKKKECKTVFTTSIIACYSDGNNFLLNPDTGYATSSQILGWTFGANYKDSMVVIAWKCESF